MIPKPLKVEAINAKVIWIKFDDGVQGQIDLSYLFKKPIFKKLENPTFFSQVYIDSETDAIAWNEELEICPNTLYLKISGLSLEQWKNKNLTYATD